MRWPIRAEGRLRQRLSMMPVRIEYNETAPSDAWRADWPEVPAAMGVRERTMTQDKTAHDHTAEEERRIREAALDETIADSFPASDPPSSDPNPDDHSALKRKGSTVPGERRRNP